MLIVLIAIVHKDSIKTYVIGEERISARYHEFRNSPDMYSTIYVRQMDRFPALFDDTKYVIMSLGGVAPLFDALSIRGGGTMENGIFINGIPLMGSPHRFMTFLPIDRDAVATITLHRGNMPADYEGFLSAVMELETDSRTRYVKGGIPSVNFSIRGLYGDYFWPGPLMGDNFRWTSLFSTWKGGPASTLLAHSCQTYRNIMDFYDFAEGDTLFEWRECITTAGISYRKSGLKIHYTFESKEHYDTSNVFQYATRGTSNKHLLGMTFRTEKWGSGFQYHRYDFGGAESHSAGILMNQFAMGWIYRRFRWGEAGVEFYSQGKVLPLIRWRHKHFLDSTRAITLFFGTTSQGYVSFGFPIFERVIVRGKVNYGYTLIAGYERILPGFSLQVNGFVRYFHPYYVLNPLLFPTYIPDTAVQISPDEYFTDRSTFSAGMDLTLHEHRKGDLTVSLTILRSFFTDTWTPSPEDIFYVFNFNYRYLNVLWMHGPIRYEQVLNPQNRTYRESSLYIYSIAVPFRWKGLDFRIGIYNIFPRSQPADEFSAIYRAFPIPILSVKKGF